MQTTTRQRPLGVTVLAILSAIAGVFGLFGYLVAFGFLSGLGFIWVVIALIGVILSIAYLGFAWGAWTLQPWAWTLGVGLAAASILLTILGFTQRQDIVGSLISIVISAVILWYLFQPDVKAAFGRA